MPEQEPQYFKEFREHIDSKFDAIDKRFIQQEKYILVTVKDIVETAVDELAVITAKNFDRVNKDMAGIKDRLDRIESHVSGHEIKLKRLERTVFA